jgi:putative OmpL-like beta-barrel porin-2
VRAALLIILLLAGAGPGRVCGGGAEGAGEAEEVLGGAQALRVHREQLHVQPHRRGRAGTNELRYYDFDVFKNTILALNADYAFEKDEAFLSSLGTRQNNDAVWWGVAGYVAYDFTDWFRLALRQEFFRDESGARTGFGNEVNLLGTPLTAQLKIWKGLVARAEYRHDTASEKVFKARTSRPDAWQGVSPQSKTLETTSISLFYSFF